MLKFVIRRILWTIPVLLLVILMTFLMMRQIGGNPFRTSERAVPPAIQANLERKFHVDQPWWKQYYFYTRGIFTLDLGPSLTLRNQSVNDIVKDRFPTSLHLGVLAMLWALVVGIPLGIIAALRPNSWADYITMAFVNVGYALPNFLISTLLIYFFAVRLRDQTGLPTNGWESWEYWILPAIALGHAPMTIFARITRGSMLESVLPTRDVAWALLAFYMGIEQLYNLDGDSSRAERLFDMFSSIARLGGPLLRREEGTRE